jgi:hypothetical protein
MASGANDPTPSVVDPGFRFAPSGLPLRPGYRVGRSGSPCREASPDFAEFTAGRADGATRWLIRATALAIEVFLEVVKRAAEAAPVGCPVSKFRAPSRYPRARLDSLKADLAAGGSQGGQRFSCDPN